MCLANRSSGRRFDAVDKIGNRIARRNGNQEVDVISLSGKNRESESQVDPECGVELPVWY